jgi:hypothetical protein
MLKLASEAVCFGEIYSFFQLRLESRLGTQKANFHVEKPKFP